MATSDAPTAADVARIVAASVRDRLPLGWKATETLEPERGALRPDRTINLEAPDGRTVRLRIEIKQVLERRDIGRIHHIEIHQLQPPHSDRRQLHGDLPADGPDANHGGG